MDLHRLWKHRAQLLYQGRLRRRRRSQPMHRIRRRRDGIPLPLLRPPCRRLRPRLRYLRISLRIPPSPPRSLLPLRHLRRSLPRRPSLRRSLLPPPSLWRSLLPLPNPPRSPLPNPPRSPRPSLRSLLPSPHRNLLRSPRSLPNPRNNQYRTSRTVIIYGRSRSFLGIFLSSVKDRQIPSRLLLTI